MMFKRILPFICLFVCLFAMASVCASDANDTAIASEDTREIELSHEIESADDNLGTCEEQTVTQTDNEEKTGTTDDGTFRALRSKISSASSGDTVYLENNYSCEDSGAGNLGISIYTSNLVIDGQGHTIDAKQKTRIFNVDHAENVTIKNIKFINAKGNSVSAGAIEWDCSDGGCVSGCSFVNCSADLDGGAIEWYKSANGSVSGCSFVNCSAVKDGGAIEWYKSANGSVSDCVFINNTDSKGKAINMLWFSASLNRNWFGNTAENYKTSPNAYIDGVDPDNWLFLNASINPNPISFAETADIIFKLYLYNSTSGNITDYTSLVKVDLTLDSNGKLDKNVVGLDEKVTFTPTSSGTGSIKATIGNATYTTTITVNKLKTELFTDSITATYNINKNLIITLKDSEGKALTGVKVTVDLNGAKTYTTDGNGQVKVSTKGLVPKTYTGKITFNGNTNYAKSTKDVKVTVKKATPKITAKKKTYKKSKKTKKYTIILKDNTGKTIKNAKLTLKIAKKTYKAKTNAKGKATFKIKKLTKKGKYKATVKYNGNYLYNKVSKKVQIRIK